MDKGFIKLNIGDTVVSGSGRVWKKLSDVLAGTWVFNDTINLPTNLDDDYLYCKFYSSDDVDFIYHQIELLPWYASERGLYYVGYDPTDMSKTYHRMAYNPNDNTWVKSGYRTITILSELREVHNGYTFLAWLLANATKIA